MDSGSEKGRIWSAIVEPIKSGPKSAKFGPELANFRPSSTKLG